MHFRLLLILSIALSISPAHSTYKDYQIAGLLTHNFLRAKHKDTPPMRLNDDLCRIAEKCADHYLLINTIDHSCGVKSFRKGSGSRGENLFMSDGIYSKPDKISVAAAKAFYSEIKGYSWANGTVSCKSGEICGHFTQLIWKGSVELGVGFARSGGKAVVVALYKPPGNMMGDFGKHVQPPTNKTVDEGPYKFKPEFSSTGMDSVTQVQANIGGILLVVMSTIIFTAV